tara:strand:- start:1073 stop:2410 length:1338 start_codon:yes stop_codon:yes gene_type:complete
MNPQFTHILSKKGKTYTFNIGGAGCEKKVTRCPIFINKDPLYIFGFGQDSLGIFKTDSQLLISLADGHGPKIEGKYISYKVHEYILPLISQEEQTIIDLIKQNDNKSINSLICAIFEDVNKIILYEDENTSKFNRGGTTFTLVHKIIDQEDGTLYSLTYNVGDSPHFKISLENEIQQRNVDHNCDSMESVEEYYNYCLEKDITPSSVILGRFNMRSHFQAIWMGYNTINPFILDIVEGKYKLKSNTEVMRKFYEEAPTNIKETILYNGGPQSIRGRERNIKALSQGEFPIENFGSTLDGDLQNFNSFGDKISVTKHNIMCRPNIFIDKITKDHYDFIGSDGPVDCLTDTDILELFKQKPSMDMEEFTELVTNTIDIKALEGGFPLSTINNIPTWDDNSFWVVSTEYVNDYELRIKELEEENEVMLKLGREIEKQIRTINRVIDKL